MRLQLVILIIALNATPLWAADASGGGDGLEITPRQGAGRSSDSPAAYARKLIQIIGVKMPPEPRWEKSGLAQALAGEVKDSADAFTSLLIPPGFPNVVPGNIQEVRERAAWVLGLSADRRALQPLINSAVYDPEANVRAAAGQALVLLDEPVALRKLLDIALALDSRKFPWCVRQSACQALKCQKPQEVITRVLRELSYELAGGNFLDPNNKPRGIVSGLGTENALMLPDAHTPTGQPLPETQIYPVLSALKELTGKSFDKGEKDVRTWQQWWNKDGAKFEFKH